MFLEGIGSGLVHHMNQSHVAADVCVRQFPEGDFRQDGNVLHAQRRLHGDRRAHVVRASGKHPQHGAGVFRIKRLAQGNAIQKNECIRADDSSLGVFPEDGRRLGCSIMQAQILRWHGGILQLVRFPDDSGKIHPCLCQQIFPPRGLGSQNDGGKHGRNEQTPVSGC